MCVCVGRDRIGMTSSEKRDLLFEKAKEFWKSRKKHVRLNLPKSLDVEAELSKDLRRLRSLEFIPEEIPQSEVTCETYDSLFTVTRKLKFGEKFSLDSISFKYD